MARSIQEWLLRLLQVQDNTHTVDQHHTLIDQVLVGDARADKLADEFEEAGEFDRLR